MNVLLRPLEEFKGILYKTLLSQKYCHAKLSASLTKLEGCSKTLQDILPRERFHIHIIAYHLYFLIEGFIKTILNPLLCVHIVCKLKTLIRICELNVEMNET